MAVPLAGARKGRQLWTKYQLSRFRAHCYICLDHLRVVSNVRRVGRLIRVPAAHQTLRIAHVQMIANLIEELVAAGTTNERPVGVSHVWEQL